MKYLVVTLFLLFSCWGCKETLDPQQQARLNQQLLEAVRIRDLNKVDSLLAAGAEATATDAEGTPALIYATNVGGLQLVELLINRGADVNARRAAAYASTPLMEAAVRNDVAIAKLLLQKGAKVNLRDTFGDPAINWASYYGHIDYVDLLVENGAGFNVESQHGTALEVAMKQWHDRLVEYFIQKGAGSAIEDPSAEELLRAVKGKDSTKVAQLLEEGGNPNQTDEVGTPVIVTAASQGSQAIVEQLIAAEADLNAMNMVGQTALSRAAYFGHYSICKDLIEAGADIHLAGERYRLSPIISAANGGHAAILDILIDAGAKINSADAVNGFTPLMFGVAYGYPEVVRELIKAGANPYIKTPDGAGLFDLLGYTTNKEIRELLEAYVSE